MSSPVIIYDGVCHLCNATVNFIIRHERESVLKFSPNQSDFAKDLLAQAGMPAIDPDSIIFVNCGEVFICSDAVIRIAPHLKWPWSMARFMVILPRRLRDWLYRIVADNRYRLFGKADACIMPDKSIKGRFIGL